MEASSRGDGGRRGRICRDALAWLNDGSPPGTEVSSGPSNTRRSWGRGVEEANGITRARTPGNPGVRSYSSPTTFCPSERRTRRSRRCKNMGKIAACSFRGPTARGSPRAAFETARRWRAVCSYRQPALPRGAARRPRPAVTVSGRARNGVTHASDSERCPVSVFRGSIMNAVSS